MDLERRDDWTGQQKLSFKFERIDDTLFCGISHKLGY